MSSGETGEELTKSQRKERFMALLGPVRHRLAHFARAMTRNHDDAQDLISDTVLAAFERFEQVKDQKAFLAYLFTIAARIHKRRSWRARLFDRYDPEKAASVHDRGTSPDVSADIRALYDAMARLPARQREAVALFEISGLSLEEIRNVQGGSISAVKMRLVRGRKQLALLLGVGEPAIVEEDETIGRESERAGIASERVAPRLAYLEANGNG
jgi:RNA polymerase sigma-70 factor (ECF subfamily)